MKGKILSHFQNIKAICKSKLERFFTRLCSDPKALAVGADGKSESSVITLLFANPNSDREALTDIQNFIKPITRMVVIAITIVIGVFGVWSGLAQLDSAAIAPGSVVLEYNRKTIQHLEGGIIARIFVEEGSIVKEGQPLLELNQTAVTARRDLLQGQLHTAQANEARLIAERDFRTTITFPPNILALEDHPSVANLIDTQKRLFSTRTEAIRGQEEVMQQQIFQYQEQIKGLGAQKKSTEEQIAFIAEEAEGVESLYKKGYAEKTRFLSLKRKMAELQGNLGEYQSQISQIQESISEATLKIFNLKNDFQKETIAELKETQERIASLKEELLAATDVVDRTIIAAPQSGKVTGLKFHTVGGVISPGTPILDIVPNNDRLLIEARVSPQDIDIVYEGLDAKVMLSAYKSRFVPRVLGKVDYISGDRFTDEKTGEAYYTVRIALSEEAMAELPGNVELYPGMPAEAYIVTGSRTFLKYLFSPILDSFRKSFREE